MFGFWRNLFARNISNSLVWQGNGNLVVVENAPTAEPRLDWIAPNINAHEFDLLRWSARIAPLTGRETEMAALREWATCDQAVAGRFIAGPGGAGKTRLAAELAQELLDKGWTAGFIDLSHGALPPTPLRKNGVLLIADYPDEKPDGVRALLSALARPPADVIVRLLLLTRDDPTRWLDEALQAGASHLFGRQHLTPAPPLDESAAWMVFEMARANLRKAGFPAPKPVKQPAFIGWLQRHDLHRLALFVTALALHTVLAPDEPALTLTGREVVAALVARERRRLREISTAHGMEKYGLERLTALAAVRGGLDEPTCRRLAAPALDIGLGGEGGLMDRLGKAGMLRGGRLSAPEPDIVAAALLAEVVAGRPDPAPEWLWAALEGDVEESLARLNRLIWDGEFILKYAQPRLSETLAQTVAKNPERAAAVEPFLQDLPLPIGLNVLGITVFKEIIDLKSQNETVYKHYSNLSICFRGIGNNTEALNCAKNCVSILSKIEISAETREYFACSIMNLSIIFSELKMHSEALRMSIWSSGLFMTLLYIDENKYNGELGRSLFNLSNRYSQNNDIMNAISKNREAIYYFERAKLCNTFQWEPELAAAQHNLAIHLLMRDAEESAKLINKSIETFYILAEKEPSRYAAELGNCLATKALLQKIGGATEKGINTLKQAIRLTKPHGDAFPGSAPAQWLANMENMLAEWTAAGA